MNVGLRILNCSPQVLLGFIFDGHEQDLHSREDDAGGNI